MNRRSCVLSWALALALLGGCGDDADGADNDGHDEGGSDAGPAADAGGDDGQELVWVPLDAGTRDETTGSGGGATRDEASPLAGRSCAMPREALPDVLLPRCSATTRDCVASCAEEEDADSCREQCLEADEAPPETALGLRCPSCVYLQLFACIDAAGCAEGVAEFFCCLEDRCSDSTVENCGEVLCGNELRTAVTCGYFADESCVDYLDGPIGACFAGADADADGGV